MKKELRKLILVYIGCFIQAFAVTCILKPNNLVVGGMTGLSLSIASIIHVNYTYIYYILCLIILIFAKFVLGNKEVKKIILLSLTYPLILIFVSKHSFNFMAETNDKILMCLYYGIFMGVGTGLVLKNGFSQGSSDTLAKILHKKFLNFIDFTQVLLGIDITILLLSAFIFGKTSVLYALIMQFVYTKTISFISFGFGNSLVKVVIISNKLHDISEYIADTMQRSYSVGTIRGGYDQVERKKIILVCTLREAMNVKDFIKNIDPHAFLNIVPTIGAWGREDGLQKLRD